MAGPMPKATAAAEQRLATVCLERVSPLWRVQSLAKEAREEGEASAKRQAVLRKPAALILLRLRRTKPVWRASAAQGQKLILAGRLRVEGEIVQFLAWAIR